MNWPSQDPPTYHGRVGLKMLPQADVWSRLAVRIGVHARRRVNTDIDIAMASEGVGFAGKAAVLDSDAVLTLSIQLAGYQRLPEP